MQDKTISVLDSRNIKNIFLTYFHIRTIRSISFQQFIIYRVRFIIHSLLAVTVSHRLQCLHGKFVIISVWEEPLINNILYAVELKFASLFSGRLYNSIPKKVSLILNLLHCNCLQVKDLFSVNDTTYDKAIVFGLQFLSGGISNFHRFILNST